MPPVEVAFACVGEDRSEWLDRLWNVVFSVRSFGGALAGAPFHVFVADSASDRLRDLLVPLGATVSVVAPWRADYRLANKLRMFEAASSLDADVVIALDCDTVVLGDVTPLLDAAAVRALPAEHDRLQPHQWASLYAHLGLTPPTERVVMTKTGATTFPYYNSGVVMVPTTMAAALYDAWDGCLRELLALGDRLPDPSKAEQRAFAFALQRANLPLHRLPISANWSSKKTKVPTAYRNEVEPPFVLHYHRKVDDDGFLWRPEHAALAPTVAEFNRRRAAALGLAVAPIRRRPLRYRLRSALTETRLWRVMLARTRRFRNRAGHRPRTLSRSARRGGRRGAR